MDTPLRLLVAESESAEARAARRATVGRTSGESYIATLRSIAPGAVCDIVRPHEIGAEATPPHALGDYDAVFLSGSPMHVYEDTSETRRQLAFMRAVFASGTPSFGSCAGLQVAVAAAGGTVGKAARHEIGFARRITATATGQGHPLLSGRPASWDALSIHSDRVETLPPGASLLAGNAICPVQAVEIRLDRGIFWGVQYHPELTLAEIAAAMRRQSDDLLQQGVARDEDEVEHQAALLDALDEAPVRRDLKWRLGVNDEITETARRQRELRNFLERLVLPVRASRG
ncbi:type 1 glutamine amidotransferase [Lichenicola cladoniae]|uniref:Type 1 glutamine amidotransferase n=1 Tax=Lichenicola cladoniae TaxID=1484109 RepID=A0A6M8HQY9_9PROT|nr:type 1 glutamine amidotransferase [Lichenicola cladoniae]NPD69066.1 type 1 glutamine amidotransferase [Acetobacteraceae bacterium]QKE90893.1 type 1 glutamine amidotransferase [Lichenicola cladoniae]